MQTGYRFLEPQALARVKNLSVVARGRGRGLHQRSALQPLQGLQRRVRRAPRIHGRRRPAAPRLPHVGPHRPPLRQAVRGRDQHAGADPAGHQRLDGLQLRRQAQQAGLRLVPDGGARLPDDPAAGLGGADHLRHGDPAGHARPQLAAPLQRDDAPAGSRSSRAGRPTWPRRCTSWPTASSAAA